MKRTWPDESLSSFAEASQNGSRTELSTYTGLNVPDWLWNVRAHVMIYRSLLRFTSFFILHSERPPQRQQVGQPVFLQLIQNRRGLLLCMIRYNKQTKYFFSMQFLCIGAVCKWKTLTEESQQWWWLQKDSNYALNQH